MIIVEILRNIFLVPLELIFEVIFTASFNLTHSEGAAIIILSLVVSTLVLPLYKKAEQLESEEREKEKQLSHWVDHIKKNFSGDEKYMMLDAYYRENNYSPIYQLKSSLSILLQIPFFMAAYDLLGVRAASRFAETGFLFFYNLGEPDQIFSIGSIHVNAMPILMTMISILTTYIYTKGQPAKTVLKSLILPVLFLVLLYNMPSSLLLYWTMNNLYSLVKTILLKNTNASVKHKKDTKRSDVRSKGNLTDRIIMFFEQEPKKSLFVLPMVFMSVLTGLLIPLAYLSASPEEFVDVITAVNPLSYLISSFFVSVGFFLVWPGVFYYLANKIGKNVISVLMIGIAFSAAVNYLFFGTETGTINTVLVFDQAPSFSVMQKALNIGIVLLIIAACFLLYRFKNVLRFVFVAAILATVCISAINAKTVQDSYAGVMAHIEDFREDEAPKITLSADGNNVMVIMLDRAVSGYIPYAFYAFPELEEQFDGFVYYPNTMTFGQNTLKTSSALFGGYDYTPENIDQRADESLAEKHDESLKVLPKLFSDEGYTTTLIELPFPGWSWNDDYSAFEDIENCYSYHAKDYYSSDTEAHENVENRRNRNMFMYSIFRCSPLLFQEMIYDSGNYLSVQPDDYNKMDTLENYRVLENLSAMTIVDGNCSGSLFLMDNQTTHDTSTIANFDPYSPREFVGTPYIITDGTNELYMWTEYQQSTFECTVAAMRELGNYMDYLKEIGVYDNTRIIIVSDHGTGVYLFEDLVAEDFNAEWYNCLLMVKDFDSTGYATDNTFMTNADVPSIALEGIVDDPVNPYTGNPINTEPKNGDLYVSYSLTPDEKLWNPDLNQGNTFYYDENCEWYKLIGDDVFDKDNWVLTDKPEV